MDTGANGRGRMNGVPPHLQDLLRLEDLRVAGWLGEGDVHFGRFCARQEQDSEARRVTELLFAAVSRFLALGHACVPLAVLAGEVVRSADGTVVGVYPAVEELRLHACRSLAVTLATDLEGGLPLSTPLVLDQEERLFIARYFDHERALAHDLTKLMGSRVQLAEKFDLPARLNHYFPLSGGSDEEDMQRRAAELALSRPVVVITGGPGTGKTSTVVKILALIAEEAGARGAKVPLVRLLAPTGKAAARVLSAVQSAAGGMDLTPEVAAALPQGASTIHRALGTVFDNPTRFRKGKGERMRADLVIVDEASMVDLALMRHLVAALEEGTRLILLGDRFQLASVEAGSVLYELCNALEQRTADATSHADPAGEGARVRELQSSVELIRSYRFSKSSGIYSLSRAFRDGDAALALSILKTPSDDLAWIEERPRPGQLVVLPEQSPALRHLLTRGFSEALSHSNPQEVYSALSEFRVLCAHRRGAFGVTRLNEVIEGWLRALGKLPAGGEYYRGRPLLITQNDYGVGLHNGDVGLCWPDGEGRIGVLFPLQDGEFRTLSPAQLPAHETAFAMTIHKSQGSEHTEVVLILPESHSPLLSRELTYTGITRAKKMMTLFSSSATLEQSAERQVSRYTGLASAFGDEFSRNQRRP